MQSSCLFDNERKKRRENKRNERNKPQDEFGRSRDVHPMCQAGHRAMFALQGRLLLLPTMPERGVATIMSLFFISPGKYHLNLMSVEERTFLPSPCFHDWSLS